MSPRYLLDANTCILLMIGDIPSLVRRIGECEEGELAISAIALAEVALGSANGKPPATEALAGFLEEVIVLPFDDAAAQAYATLPFRRGSFDRLIAAHAKSLGLILVTNNVADFADVPGLVVEDWTLA